MVFGKNAATNHFQPFSTKDCTALDELGTGLTRQNDE
ncbi:hypothetical protein WLH_05891 [Escherichia coli O25b:H4]|uniref:Uncharacterized protein n=1 Tax=Escherichia coli O25b:H4 TaxID=941280 RepID=A0A192CN54_ECO25|nr:hypothetical protein WLH_05891 [Escherichia coli O25b:H4]